MGDDVIDLTDDTPKKPQNPVAKRPIETNEDEAKRRIRQFAKAVNTGAANHALQQPPDSPPITLLDDDEDPMPKALPSSDDHDNNNNDEHSQRERIMSAAKEINEKQNLEFVPMGNAFLAQLHQERIARRGPPPSPAAAAAAAATQQQQQQPENKHFSLLSYNVWFREDVQLQHRLKAIGNIISQTQPDVVCFQEVTENVYTIMRNSEWWKQGGYKAYPSPYASDMTYFTMMLWKPHRLETVSHHVPMELPFENSVMGRDMKLLRIKPKWNASSSSSSSVDPSLAICTTHLESPTGFNQLYSQARQTQCKRALELLDNNRSDVIFIGDMNWTENNDGRPPLPSAWVDVWPAMHGANDAGFSYDTEANPMLNKGQKRKLRLRLDRAFARLSNWEVESIELVGKEPIEGGVTFEGRPVLPSDHYGLHLKLKLK